MRRAATASARKGGYFALKQSAVTRFAQVRSITHMKRVNQSPPFSSLG